MTDFYLTLPSHSSATEFVNNSSSRFKNRLPYVLHLTREWEVGLASVSIPDAGIQHEAFLRYSDEDPLLIIKYKQLSVNKELPGVRNETIKITHSDVVNFNNDVHDGVSFMKALVRHYERRISAKRKPGDLYTFLDKRNVPTFRWEGDELLLDYDLIHKRVVINESDHHATKTYMAGHQVVAGDPPFSVKWNANFAVDMGWATFDQVMGPNMNQELSYTIPTFGDAEVDQLRVPTPRDIPPRDGDTLWYITSTDDTYKAGLYLSCQCNWRFSNLNKGFSNIEGNANRSLYLNSNVGQTSIVGNVTADLLKEIQYQRTGHGTFYYEPNHIQYMPLRNEVIDIIETNITEVSGKPVKFGEGNTIVTLHFRKKLQ